MYEPRKRIVLSQKKYDKLKRYVFDRDKGCVWCKKGYTLTPAHIKRRSQGGDDSPNNIVCGCLECHTDFDAYRIELPDSVSDMLKTEPLYLE